MALKHNLLAGVAMTASEMRLGRYLRAPEGHGDAGSTPAPSPAPSEAPPAEGEQDFSEFENSVDNPPKEGEDATSSATKEGEADNEDPPASDEPKDAPPEEQRGEPTEAEKALQRERDEARREADEFRRRLEALEKGDDKPKEGDEEKTRDPDARPDPDDYEFGEADSKYIEDLAGWKADQRFNQREQERALREEVAQMERVWTEKVSDEGIKTKYPDFDEKVTKGADRGDWDLSPVGTMLVKASPVGPDVAYHLATNPAESKRIASLNFVEQALEIGRLEGRFMNAGTQPAKPAKIASDAPPPPQERSRGAGGKFTVDADTDDFASFEAKADGILNKK